MKLRSAARRLSVTIPFFTVAALVLGSLEDPAIPVFNQSVDGSPLVLIVTTEALHQPFHALETWNQARGCPVKVVTLLELGKGSMVDTELDLVAACRALGATGLLLGGTPALIPLFPESFRIQTGNTRGAETPQILPVPRREGPPFLDGVPMGRAPVADLDEAWAFVEACRTSGRTLDHLIGNGSDLDVALALPSHQGLNFTTLPLASLSYATSPTD